MLAPPMDAEEVEQARARVSGAAQQIYDDTEKAVKQEIGRLDAAQAWAEKEMDRITAAALKDLDDGKDPEGVRKRLDEDLQATIAKASDPAFDPRRLDASASTPSASTPGASTLGASIPGASTPGASIPGASTPGASTPRTSASRASAAVGSPAAVTPTDPIAAIEPDAPARASAGCGCHASRDPRALALAIALALALPLRRRR